MNLPLRDGVTLVYPYFRSSDPVPRLFPPLGIAYLASQMREMEVAVDICDCTFRTFSEAVEEIAGRRPAIVGISIMVTMSGNAFRLLEALRTRLPGTLFVAGGPLPTVHPAMFTVEFDAVFCGEGDVAFPSFCRDYLAGREDPGRDSPIDVSRYPGLCMRVDGGLRSTPPVHNPPEVLDRLPLPDRAVFDHARYQEAMEGSIGCRQTSIMVTRGCPYSCDFCSKPVWGNAFRKPLLEKVFAEIDGILSLGYDSLWIADDCFTLDTGFLTGFCNGMILRDKPVSWTCLSRVDRLDSGLVGLMKDAGCTKVFLGLESGSDTTLQLMNKRVTVREGTDAVNLFSNAGIATAGFFMVGYPGETHDSVERTFAHSLSLPLEEAWFTIPLPLPGTPLFSRVADIGTWEDWDFSNQVKFVYHTDFDTVWLKKRIDETMGLFRAKKLKAGVPNP